MKDSYSFHKDKEELNKEFEKMYKCYTKIFKDLGLNFKTIEACAFEMKGEQSIAFVVPAEIGECEMVFCEKCNYVSEQEIANCLDEDIDEEILEKELVYTENIKTSNEVASFFCISKSKVLKSLAYKGKNGIVLAIIKGDDILNEERLFNLVGEQLEKLHDGMDFGFIGPTYKEAKIVADESVIKVKNHIIGSNQKDYHFKNANCYKDWQPDLVGRIKKIKNDDKCCCGNSLKISQGIEIAQIYKLGDKYSKSFENFIYDNGEKKYLQMGCYGIGISRLLGTIVESFGTDVGINWPKKIAPFDSIVLIANMNDKAQVEKGMELYKKLKKSNDVALDDRDCNIGFKINDAKLIGIPNIFVVNKQGIFKDEKIFYLKKAGGEGRI